MRTHRIASLAVMLAAALTGCNSARPLAEGTASNCTGCHGGKDNSTGAPPYDRNGLDKTPAVGAHTTHLDDGVTCDSCHVVPENVNSPGHITGGPATVTFGPAAKLNGASPQYDHATHACSGTYCHGATLHDGAKTTVGWSDIGQVDCTSCHGYPPVSVAPHSSATLVCHSCHADTVDANETPIPGGKHMNGTVDVNGHPANWVTVNANNVMIHGLAADYHDPAYPNGLNDCRTCHGTNLDGGIANVSCDKCHTNATAAWRTDCTFCHGTSTRSQNPAAPPVDTQGNTTPASLGVGAHQTHLFGRTENPISDGVLCTDCHTVPTDISHVNGQVQLALKQPGTANAIGAFDPNTGNCSNVYCHGNFRNGKAQASTTTPNVPVWTATSGQNACDTCHSAQTTNPTDGHVVTAHLNLGCSSCHGTGYGTPLQDNTPAQPTLVNPTLHVNGTVNTETAQSNFGYSTTAHTCSQGCHAADAAHTWF
ncbi:CxxxxCH/CxxCH domain c-type cytochrome [Anaeromyxobacter oryzae]|uniref:CxxxxCH/CxxCH domain-containing protein n=1 Tax=Anaeromyxobacter oryzae TaxID=2918170 RepID=A0ABN6MY57_9BACT|nr:CxxxxCH/CxxCH domain-containing protein [Anaeromyxobacter oryzae]BDG05811.1 hypothetical protein AMOR_48070 [Anaeromyxobacter oryzae]